MNLQDVLGRMNGMDRDARESARPVRGTVLRLRSWPLNPLDL